MVGVVFFVINIFKTITYTPDGWERQPAGALLGFAHGLAAEVGPYGVTVNCVAPGLTRTAKAQESLSMEFFQHIASIQSIKRNGTPEDQAGVVSFLASDDAGFITGQTLLVDGGQGRT